ncbi:MAG: biotin/lipoyl-binding protein [Candidatus Omnitrophica bacterium]|nr:biotin/lipoyl-binding protein [Candidatus Omnitrophota bacterium]MCM8790135.1 biotin/lipoyl-binding protein [Candidatus Omnitrophota bacterium]
MTDVKLPVLAEGVNKATVAYWHKSVGDAVKEGEDLVELVTDKATFNMPSPASGVLKEVLISEGAEVSVGQLLARIE